MCFGQFGERHVHRDLVLLARLREIGLTLLSGGGLPRLHRTFGERLRAIRDGQMVVDADDAAEAFAGRARADRMIEAEERGRGLGVFEIAGGAVELVGEVFRALGFEFRIRVEFVNRQSSFAEVIRLLAGFGETGAVRRRELQAILDDREVRDVRCEVRKGFVDAENLGADEEPLVALLDDEVERFLERELLGKWNGEGDQAFRPRMIGRGGTRPCQRVPHHRRRLRAHELAALLAVKLREVRPEQLHVVAQLGHRADSRARGADGVALLDGDGRWNAFDAVNLRLVHPVEKLPCVRREGLDVTTLAFGEKRVEGEGTFAGAAEAGDDGELPDRDIEIEILEVIVAHSAQADGVVGCTALRHQARNLVSGSPSGKRVKRYRLTT